MNDTPIPFPLTKRLFDSIAALVCLAALSPILLAAIIAIKIEGLCSRANRGPIFYSETRISQGLPFTLRKLRIFKTSAYEPIRSRGEIVHTKPLEKNPANLTTVGKIIKKFYLDEAPQLFSVLTGDMSMVGPRPWNPVDYEKEVSRGIYRKKIIKAGLTGPVQIHKHDAQKHGGEHKLDNDYSAFVKNKNGLRVALHDAGILLKSVLVMLRGEGL